MTDALYAPFPRSYRPPEKRVPHKCSTCANTVCAARWRAVDWTHCGEWTPPADQRTERP